MELTLVWTQLRVPWFNSVHPCSRISSICSLRRVAMKTKKKKTFGYYSSSSPIHSFPFFFHVMVIFPAPWERPTTDLYLDNVERDDTSDFSHYANHRSAQELQPKWNFPIKFHSFKFGTWIEWRWQMDDKCRIRLQRSSGCERVTDLSAIHFFVVGLASLSFELFISILVHA